MCDDRQRRRLQGATIRRAATPPGIKHIRTRPYTPRANGKAVRFFRTLLREWAYAFVYPSSGHRDRELQPWIYHYDFHRPHPATSHRPPIPRLGFEGNNVLRNYS